MRHAVRAVDGRTFRSLRRHRNYRLYFAGQVVSLSGTWMQNIALAWLVIQLSHSPLAVGGLAFCRFVPFTVLGLFAGVIADRIDNRRLVIGTQTASMTLSAILAALTLSGTASLAAVYVLAVLLGTAQVIDAPSRQALTYQMVGQDELPNAIALNSSLFNMSRVVGPALAGLVLAARGQDPAEVTLTSTRRSAAGYWWTLGRAISLAFAADPEGVAAAVEAHDEAYEDNGLYDDYPTVFGAVMEIGLRFDDRDLLHRLVRVVDDAGALAPAGLRGHRALLGAWMAMADDADEGVESLCTAAIREYDAWGSPVYVARARAAYGVWLSRCGRTDDAEPVLAAARAQYGVLGASAWQAELDGALSGVVT